MIEVPSAVTMSDALAREADFFSIGSNDLIQYSLGVDRSNERVAHLYDALDPAVLRAIDQTVRSAHSCGIPVGSCGEMSGEILGVFMLVGLGVDDLSVGSRLVPLVKTVLGQVRARDLEELARHCLQAGCPSEVREVIRGGLRGYPQFRVVEHADRIQCRWDPAASG
ncbi:MAG: hypothetical protein IMY84_05880, partial [Chloroflexi bacterium]|nr:hypothetical protein [Chloroflexota bacterium]